MATIAETARVVTGEPSDLTTEVQRNAWLLWRSVTTECERKRASRTSDGFWVYQGTFRGHVMRLWPTLEDEARKALERELYSYLSSSGMARCIQRKSPTVWHVAVTWTTVAAVAVPFMRYRMSHAEKRVTPQEAGEHLEPGEVIVRHKETTKETQVGASTASMINLAKAQEQRQNQWAEEHAARHGFIVDCLKEYSEPLAADEVAFATGLELSYVRKALQAMAQEGKVHGREETSEERIARYGGTQPRATKATLYSLKKRVPARTTYELVEGFAKQPAEFERLGSHDVVNRLARYFAKVGTRTTFDAVCVSDKTHVPVGTVRHRLKAWADEGTIKRVGHKNGRNVFQLVKKEKLLADLDSLHLLNGNGNGNGNGEAAAQPTGTVTVTKTPPVPAPQPGLDLLQRAGEILDENERLREQNARLLEKVAELEARVEELQSAPRLDEGVAQRLRDWTPSN